MKKFLKVLLIIVVILVILSLVFYFFGLSILSFFSSIFLKNNPPVQTTDGVAYLFEDIENFHHNPLVLEGMKLESLNVNTALFLSNISTDLETALEIFRVGEANLSLLHTFGVFLDIDAPDVQLTMGTIKAQGAMTSQIMKIQNGDSFFMNEAFTLRSVEFQSLTSTKSLEDLLIQVVNGGNRIYYDSENSYKWIQFAPLAGARYDEEKKLVTLSLEDATLGYIKDPSLYYTLEDYFSDEIHHGYNKEYEFQKILMVDFSHSTVSSATTKFFPSEKYYRIEYNMNAQGLTASPKSAGAIANLLGYDDKGNPNVKKIDIYEADYIVEVWDNGLLKSVKGKMDWGGESNILPMPLKANVKDTKINFYFSYSELDCSNENIRERYYEDVKIRRKCSLITEYPDVPIIKDDRFDCTSCADEE